MRSYTVTLKTSAGRLVFTLAAASSIDALLSVAAHFEGVPATIGVRRDLP